MTTESQYDEKLWRELVEVGKTLEKGTTHPLPKPFVGTVIATLDYFGATEQELAMTKFDLLAAKYKIWDWLGMCLTGRIDRDSSIYPTIVKMAKLYILQKNVGGWAWWLRGHDLDVISEVFKCDDCNTSYKTWMRECKENGDNPDDFY